MEPESWGDRSRGHPVRGSDTREGNSVNIQNEPVDLHCRTSSKGMWLSSGQSLERLVLLFDGLLVGFGQRPNAAEDSQGANGEGGQGDAPVALRSSTDVGAQW